MLHIFMPVALIENANHIVNSIHMHQLGGLFFFVVLVWRESEWSF